MIDEINEFEKCLELRKQAYSSVYFLLDRIQNTEKEQSWCTKEAAAQVSNTWKESYLAVSKLGKRLDKRFKPHLNNSAENRIHEKTHLNTALVHHFYRLGNLDLVETFTRETGIVLDEQTKTRFTTLFFILHSLSDFDLGPAIQWATANREYLDQRSSDIEFQLARLFYLSLLLNGRHREALQFSQTQFPRFSRRNQKEIQQLVGCLLYVKRLAASPYAHLFDNGLGWNSVRSLLIKEYSAWMGLSYESPIEICLEIGWIALPKILKVSSLMREKGIEWTLQNELAVEIPIPGTVQYHSTFSCPVLKEPSSATNPPMILHCGHVISKAAIDRLSKGSDNIRFKCPYCPGESTTSQAMVVYIE